MSDELFNLLNQRIKTKEELIERYHVVGEELEEINQLLLVLKKETRDFFKENNIPIRFIARFYKLKSFDAKKTCRNVGLFWCDRMDRDRSVKFEVIVKFLKENNFSMEIIETVQRMELAKMSIITRKPSLAFEMTDIKKLLMYMEKMPVLYKSSPWFLKTGF